MSNNNNINQVLSDDDSTEESQYNGYGDIIIPEFNGHNDDIIIQEFNDHNDAPVYSSSQDDGIPTDHDSYSYNDNDEDNDEDSDEDNDEDSDEDNDEDSDNIIFRIIKQNDYWSTWIRFRSPGKIKINYWLTWYWYRSHGKLNN